MSIKVAMMSLGCCKNQVDAEMMLGTMKNEGFSITTDVSDCDAVIINTCGFIQSAKEEAIENILEMAKLKKEGKFKAIIVTGCLAQRYKDQILNEMPEVDAVVGIGENGNICKIVKKAISGRRFCTYCEREHLPLNGERVLTTLPYYAYIKIAEGCDNRCSYCAIPEIRGRFRSRKMEDIIAEAEGLAKSGVKELIVVAQDTTRYGEDIYGEYSLARLLKELCKIDGFKWIRTLYCYPDKITDELIETIASEPKLCKYLDIPIQHCNDDILKRMNRKMGKDSIEEVFTKLRAKIPNITLRTTLITGFPGETDEQFEELCEFVKKMRFDRLGCFAYSPEEGTPAAKMENQIDQDIKEKREEIIMQEQSFIMEQLNEEKVGSDVKVITEGFDKYAECYFGRTAADAPDIDGKIFFTSEKKLTMGDFVTVHVDDVMEYDLIGTVIE